MFYKRGELEEAISHPSSAEGKLLKRFSELLKKEICFNWSKNHTFFLSLCVLQPFAQRMIRCQSSTRIPAANTEQFAQSCWICGCSLRTSENCFTFDVREKVKFCGLKW